MSEQEPTIAVLIPCLNEAVSIRKVITDFRSELPDADIYVFDNNSTDDTVRIAQEAGAIVCQESRRGKGYVLQSMFQGVEADLYVLVDGDDTYPSQAVHCLLAPVRAHEADMVVGSRLHKGTQSQWSPLNRLGNWFFALTLNRFFGAHLTDILSGYRAFSRRFVKGISLFSGGFEIETELTIKAIQRGYRILEVPVDLKRRSEGSESKIHLARDGILILAMIMSLFRDYKPLTFFGIVGLALSFVGLVSLLFASTTGNWTGEPGLWLAWMITSILVILAGFLAVSIGMVLHTIDRRFQEFESQIWSIARTRPNSEEE
ncbi:MAG: glycosyltransferase [Chloroflexi bacterium]|nr:glycosyltransferase [Chloroflexota bacterium]